MVISAVPSAARSTEPVVRKMLRCGHRGLSAVAHRRVGAAVDEAVEERVDGLVALQVDDLQLLAGPDDGRPRGAGRHDLVGHHGARPLLG